MSHERSVRTLRRTGRQRRRQRGNASDVAGLLKWRAFRLLPCGFVSPSTRPAFLGKACCSTRRPRKGCSFRTGLTVRVGVNYCTRTSTSVFPIRVASNFSTDGLSSGGRMAGWRPRWRHGHRRQTARRSPPRPSSACVSSSGAAAPLLPPPRPSPPAASLAGACRPCAAGEAFSSEASCPPSPGTPHSRAVAACCTNATPALGCRACPRVPPVCSIHISEGWTG